MLRLQDASEEERMAQSKAAATATQAYRVRGGGWSGLKKPKGRGVWGYGRKDEGHAAADREEWVCGGGKGLSGWSIDAA